MESILLQLLIVSFVVSSMQARAPCEGLSEGDVCGTAGPMIKRCRPVPSCQGKHCLVCNPERQAATTTTTQPPPTTPSATTTTTPPLTTATPGCDDCTPDCQWLDYYNADYDYFSCPCDNGGSIITYCSTV